MGIFSHVRTRFWDAEGYTSAQTEELRQVQAAYTAHLGRAFGDLPLTLQWRSAEDQSHPAWRPNTLVTSPPVTSVQPNALQTFSEALQNLLEVYTERRTQRWYRKGHYNDPLRLWIMDLQVKFRELGSAPFTQDTLNRVAALQRYLEALQSQHVFDHEPTGHDSVQVLLRNLLATLALTEDRLRYEIAASSAREHLTQLKTGVAQTVQALFGYLFYAIADKPRKDLRYSLPAAQAKLVDEKVTASLQTREGTALNNVSHHPAVVRTLLPHGNERKPALAGVSLLGGDTPTPFVDAKGQLETRWVDFLQQGTGEEQLSPHLRKLPSGICPLLRGAEEKTDNPNPLTQWLTLQGMLVTLAEYHDYLQHCWQLAGIGGDGLLYDSLAEALVSILTELQTFQTGLQERLMYFQNGLDRACTQAIEAGKHTDWRDNCYQAKTYQQRAIEQLKSCGKCITDVIAHSQDAGARQKRGALAEQAQERLRDAGRFLNQARRQMNLPVKTTYQGLALPSLLSTATSYPDDFLTQFDPLLRALVPEQTTQATRLGQLCRETPRQRPWRIFWGSRQRYDYLQKPQRLAEIAQEFHLLRTSPPLSEIERKACIHDLRRRIADEQRILERLKMGLWWPAHRASLQFFADWESTLQNGLAQLRQWEETRSGVQPTSSSLSDSLPTAAQSLSPEQLPSSGEGILTTLYQQHKACASPERKEAFETWQRGRFDGALLWGPDGQVNHELELTETDLSTILEQWIPDGAQSFDASLEKSAQVLAQGDEVIRRFDAVIRRTDTRLSLKPEPLVEEEKAPDEYTHSIS